MADESNNEVTPAPRGAALGALRRLASTRKNTGPTEPAPPDPDVTHFLYTDGLTDHDSGPGGWAIVGSKGESSWEDSGYSPDTTAVRMELTAAIRALESIAPGLPATVYTHSQVVQQGMARWIHKWSSNNWHTTTGQPVDNQDLWSRLAEVAAERVVQWEWLQNHIARSKGQDQQAHHVHALAYAAMRRGASVDAMAEADRAVVGSESPVLVSETPLEAEADSSGAFAERADDVETERSAEVPLAAAWPDQGYDEPNPLSVANPEPARISGIPAPTMSEAPILAESAPDLPASAPLDSLDAVPDAAPLSYSSARSDPPQPVAEQSQSEEMSASAPNAGVGGQDLTQYDTAWTDESKGRAMITDQDRSSLMSECQALEQRWKELHQEVLRLNDQWRALVGPLEGASGSPAGATPSWTEGALLYVNLNRHAAEMASTASQALETCHQYARALQRAMGDIPSS